MKKIVAALDFSDATQRVVDAALAQAKAFGAELHLVHVLEPEPAFTAYGFTPEEFPAINDFHDEARKRATRRLSEVAPDAQGIQRHLAEGRPLPELLIYVKEIGADLVVLGSQGHGMVASLLLGSVAEGMVRKAAVPTLLVPVLKG